MRRFADNWNKFRGGEITSMAFAEQQYSPDVEIYINTGHCPRDGKFFGVKQAKRLAEKLRENLRFLPFFDLEGSKPCPDQKLCYFSNTHESVHGERVITKVFINETEDKVARLTINHEGAEIMAEKFIELLKNQNDAHTFVKEFFSKDVRLDVENEAGQRTLTFEELPAFLDGLQHPKNTFASTGRRQCVDNRENECDFELTYEIGDKSKIFWASLTPAQDKIQRGVIREQKWLYGK